MTFRIAPFNSWQFGDTKISMRSIQAHASSTDSNLSALEQKDCYEEMKAKFINEQRSFLEIVTDLFGLTNHEGVIGALFDIVNASDSHEFQSGIVTLVSHFDGVERRRLIKGLSINANETGPGFNVFFEDKKLMHINATGNFTFWHGCFVVEGPRCQLNQQLTSETLAEIMSDPNFKNWNGEVCEISKITLNQFFTKEHDNSDPTDCRSSVDVCSAIYG